jgi:CheY-like chemotaxis protein
VRGDPKAVLFDLKLAEIDGLEILRWIRPDMDLKTMPMVMFTSLREVRRLLRSYDLGTNAHVGIPLNYHDLVEVVEQVGCFRSVVNRPPGGGDGRR